MRREPWYELAKMLEEDNHLEEALIYYNAALAIQYKKFSYLNTTELYGDLIPQCVVRSLRGLGREIEAKAYEVMYKLKKEKE